MRYQDLLRQKIEVDGLSLRELGREIGLTPPSLHNYLYQGTEPRFDALKKMSAYFNEPISQLLSEDDDLTAQLLARVRAMTRKEKQALLEQLSKSKRI